MSASEPPESVVQEWLSSDFRSGKVRVGVDEVVGGALRRSVTGLGFAAGQLVQDPWQRRSCEIDRHLDGVAAQLGGGSQGVHDPALGTRRCLGAVASPGLAVHDGGTDSGLDEPVGGVDARVGEEGEQRPSPVLAYQLGHQSSVRVVGMSSRPRKDLDRCRTDQCSLDGFMVLRALVAIGEATYAASNWLPTDPARKLRGSRIVLSFAGPPRPRPPSGGLQRDERRINVNYHDAAQRPAQACGLTARRPLEDLATRAGPPPGPRPRPQNGRRDSLSREKDDPSEAGDTSDPLPRTACSPGV